MAQIAQIEHYSSSSDDEAPEEESFQVSQQKSRSKATQLRKTLDASNSVQKNKRRTRDQMLKSKKKLLSEILAEQEQEQESEEPEEPKQQIKVVRHTVKKLEAEKEGFKVKVLKKSSSSLPPPSASSLVSRKERFLKRARR